MPKLTTSTEIETAKQLAAEVPVVRQSPVKMRDRLTTVVNIHHEHWGDNPFSFGHIGNRLLKEQEEPYSRGITVTEDWKPISLGDMPMERVGTVVIENKAGLDEVTRPNPGRQKEIDAKIIEVAYREDSNEADLGYPGGMPVVKHPNDASKLRIRCQSGEVRCRVTAFSK